MASRWNDDDARELCRQFADSGEVVALRVYTSRLLGQDATLVLHGGGNTSVKTTQKDLLGRDVEVLCVKGSGWDLVSLEPPGLPAVRLDALRDLRQLDELSDEDMVNAVRGALLDCRSPNPSVEALLHAFLPHAFVDHTHANAILALTDQPDPERHVRAALGEDVLVLPWIMPGFPLAKAVADAYDAQPDCKGIVLAKHGLFTFGDDAQQSYERTIDLVDRAQHYIDQQIGGVPAMLCESPSRSEDERRSALRSILPALRGACAGADGATVVASARTSDELAAFGAHASARELCASNPITPDHVIRTKAHYLHLTEEEWRDPDRIRRRVGEFEVVYRRYYETSARRISPDHMHDPAPVVVVLDGIGIATLHRTVKGARIAGDIAEHTVRVKAAAHALGDYVALTDDELAEMEYWPLELAKLGKQSAPELTGKVAVVTGAAGAIGCGIAEVLLERGANVLLTDVDDERLRKVSARFADAGPRMAAVVADLTEASKVEDVFGRCAEVFGGVDIVVPNAGIAHVSSIEDMDRETFARVLDVNTTATMNVLQAAARIFRLQQTGGSVILQASKNVFAPGAKFGAYSASKAAALQLARIAALEFAEMGVRVNAINADAVFGDDDVPSQLWQLVGPDRMKARGLDAEQLREFYRDRSLLKQTVTPRHVGESVAWFAAQRTPTTGAVLPVDGGLPEAFPR